MFDTNHSSPNKNKIARPNVPVLMQQQDVKPIIFISGHEHPDAVTPQLKMHSGIFDVPDTVQAKVGIAFAEKDGADCYTGCSGSFGIRQW
jgi:hypothetical protein